MITGYFLIERTFLRWNGFLKVLVQTSFYTLSFLMVVIIMGLNVDKRLFLSSLLPIHESAYWFVTMYIGLIAIAPFLSRAVKGLNKKNYRIFLYILFIMNFQFLYGRVFAGFSTIVWFSFLYLVAGYFRIFGTPEFIVKYKGLILASTYILLILLATGIDVLSSPDGKFTLISSAYDGPMFFLSLILFLYFVNTRFDRRFFELLSKIAPYTFGVYLIHENMFVRERLWKFVVPESFSCPMIIHCVFSCIVIFICCMCIDYIREKLFRIFKLNELINNLAAKLPQTTV